MKKTFIIGSSGFVAKRHMDCLYALKQNVLGLYDKKTDGYSDRYFPNAKFFLNELNFIKYLRNFKGEKQLIVCSPNYLHTKHILLGLKNGCDVLCEKPPCLNENDLKKIIKYEKKFSKKCFFVFQLRYDKNVLRIKKLYHSKKNINANVDEFGDVPTGFKRDPDWYKKELSLVMACSYGPGRYDPTYEEHGIDYPFSYVRWTQNRNMKAFQDLLLQGSIKTEYLNTHCFNLEDAPINLILFSSSM